MAFTGEIRIFAGNFPPVGWAFCQGQLMPISENDALFQLIGTTYGGDGNETFGLPDLRGRTPLHAGTDSSGYTYITGEMAGTETVTLTTNNLPVHKHLLTGTVSIPALGENPGKLLAPDNNYPAITSGLQVYSTSAGTKRLPPLQVDSISPGTMMQVQPVGGSQPHDNMQPYLVVNFIICLYGEFPSQT
jgi:microcystin-dependent protein